MTSTQSPHVHSGLSVAELQFGKNSHLSTLIHTWAQQLAGEAGTQCEWVDLCSQKPEVQSSRHHQESPDYILKFATQSIDYKPIKYFEKQKEPISREIQTETNDTGKKSSYEIQFQKTVTQTQAKTLVWELDVGLSLEANAGPFGGIGGTVDLKYSSSIAKTVALEVTKNDKITIEIPFYHRLICSREVWRVPAQQDFNMTTKVIGEVPIKFRHKVIYQEGTKGRLIRDWFSGHRKQFLSIHEVMVQLKLLKLLPAEIEYDEEEKKLILQGRYSVDRLIPDTRQEQVPLQFRNNNLTHEVKYFKRHRLHELKQKIQVLRNLRGNNSESIQCAITGLAGCGKSELAKVYALEYEFENETGEAIEAFRWYLEADPIQNHVAHASYQQAYDELLYNFGIQATRAYKTETDEHMHNRLKSMLWQKITHYSQWIVIFDNAFVEDDIQKYLPLEWENPGQILVTTQNSSFFTPHTADFSINKGLDPEQAEELLLQISGRKEDRDTAKVLVEKLGFSPLGIRIAGSYIYNINDPDTGAETCSFKQYAEILDKQVSSTRLDRSNKDKRDENDQMNNKEITLAGAILLSISRCQQHNSGLVKLLEYTAFLANIDIQWILLVKLFKDLNSSQDQRTLREWLVGHKNYSLITYDPGIQSYYLHRTTQALLRNSVISPQKTLKGVVHAIIQLYPYDRFSIDKLKICQRVSPHFISLYQHIASLDTKETLITEELSLLLILGQISQQSSRFFQALQYLNTAWQSVQKCPDLYPELQFQILRYLGKVEYCLGNDSRGREHLHKAIEVGKRIYPPPNWHLAQAYNVLGTSLYNSPERTNDESLKACQEALRICQTSQEPSAARELEMIFSYRGIGHCLRDVKAFDQAIYNYKEALSLVLKHLGDSHPSIATLYVSLGSLGFYPTDNESFTNVGLDYISSKKYIEDALQISIESHGRESIEVAGAYFWISRALYVSQEDADWEKALRCQVQEIEISVQIWGDTSIKLIRSYYWKGRILEKVTREKEAIEAYHKGLEIGNSYPSTDWIEKIKNQLQALERSS